MEKYIRPSTNVIEVKPCFLCTSETTSDNRCPICGSTDFETKEIDDKGGKVVGIVTATIASFINPSHAAHMAHHAMEYEPKKKVKVCKNCGHEWE